MPSISNLANVTLVHSNAGHGFCAHSHGQQAATDKNWKRLETFPKVFSKVF
jgi:hypothetical protein